MKHGNGLSSAKPVTSVVALSDGRRVVSGSEDHTVRVWDVNTGSCERVLEGHSRVSRISLIPPSS